MITIQSYKNFRTCGRVNIGRLSAVKAQFLRMIRTRIILCCMQFKTRITKQLRKKSPFMNFTERLGNVNNLFPRWTKAKQIKIPLWHCINASNTFVYVFKIHSKALAWESGTTTFLYSGNFEILVKRIILISFCMWDLGEAIAFFYFSVCFLSVVYLALLETGK